MKISGKRFRKTQIVQTDRLVVAVEVEAVIPDEAPDTPCYEAETVNFIRDVEAHANAGDIPWLQKHGKVYQAIGAA
jgi:hypothetical protein